VSFDAKTRGIITGEITKVNRKTVKVKADGVGFMWSVSPSLLKKVS
jgi:Holliday junction resolvasome RuvABC DNA-binding subunit